MMDLISSAMGGRVVTCNDEFFAEAANLLNPDPPVWREGVYTERGKWMDGWETRRRREPGHDWCVLALGIPGRVEQVIVDTSYFTGNYPERFSLEACGADDDDRLSKADWIEIIGATALQGDSLATFTVSEPHRVTYLRLNIYPDGGVARLRVEGTPIPAHEYVCPGGPVDLASALVGGEALEASDTHYSHPSNLLRPDACRGMWDGWETRRRRGPGHDWAIFRLGMAGTVESVVVDTTHFKGNAPGRVSIELSEDGDDWVHVADQVAVAAHAQNEIRLNQPGHASYLRLSIHPDGGVARLRIMGRPDVSMAGAKRLDYLNSLFDPEARRFFSAACPVSRWVDTMMAGRPYATVDSALDLADAGFDRLESADWLEAFASHPRIGERGDQVANREQSGTMSASRAVLAELARVNRDYEERFGFTFIVYASGKSAEEMLEIARDRLGNEREKEIVTAGHEQRRITATRLRRMLCQETS